MRGIGPELMKTYFISTLQNVSVVGCESENMDVIQGSECGPMIFEIYWNDLFMSCEAEECSMYADFIGLNQYTRT